MTTEIEYAIKNLNIVSEWNLDIINYATELSSKWVNYCLRNVSSHAIQTRIKTWKMHNTRVI